MAFCSGHHWHRTKGRCYSRLRRKSVLNQIYAKIHVNYIAVDKFIRKFPLYRDVLKNISETIKEKNRAALQDISRKAIRRINERAIAAYYVDRIDRDYFTEYFSEINDEAGSADENFFEENLNSSLLTNVEKVPLIYETFF